MPVRQAYNEFSGSEEHASLSLVRSREFIAGTKPDPTVLRLEAQKSRSDLQKLQEEVSALRQDIGQMSSDIASMRHQNGMLIQLLVTQATKNDGSVSAFLMELAQSRIEIGNTFAEAVMAGKLKP